MCISQSFLALLHVLLPWPGTALDMAKVSKIVNIIKVFHCNPTMVEASIFIFRSNMENLKNPIVGNPVFHVSAVIGE